MAISVLDKFLSVWLILQEMHKFAEANSIFLHREFKYVLHLPEQMHMLARSRSIDRGKTEHHRHRLQQY